MSETKKHVTANDLFCEMLQYCPNPDCKKPLEAVGLSGYNGESNGEAWIECDHCHLAGTIVTALSVRPPRVKDKCNVCGKSVSVKIFLKTERPVPLCGKHEIRPSLN